MEAIETMERPEEGMSVGGLDGRFDGERGGGADRGGERLRDDGGEERGV